MNTSLSFDEVFNRVQRVTYTQTQNELAQFLDIRQPSIAEAKKRQSIPADWYIKLFEKIGVDLDWIKKASVQYTYVPGLDIFPTMEIEHSKRSL